MTHEPRPYPRRPKIDGRRKKDKMLQALLEYCDGMRWACRDRRENPMRMYEDSSLFGKQETYSEIHWMLKDILTKGK